MNLSKEEDKQSSKGASPGGGAEKSTNLSKKEDLMFMQEIGWIKNKEDADRLLGQDQYTPDGVAGDAPADYRNVAIPDIEAAGLTGKSGRDNKTPTFDYNSVGAIGAMSSQSQQGGSMANPFFSGAAMVGGTLAQGGTSTKSDRRKNSAGSGKGGKQNRNRQERPEKRDGKTHAYRKR